MKTVLPGFKRSILITISLARLNGIIAINITCAHCLAVKWADIVQIITSERVISSLNAIL